MAGTFTAVSQQNLLVHKTDNYNDFGRNWAVGAKAYQCKQSIPHSRQSTTLPQIVLLAQQDMTPAINTKRVIENLWERLKPKS